MSLTSSILSFLNYISYCSNPISTFLEFYFYMVNSSSFASNSSDGFQSLCPDLRGSGATVNTYSLSVSSIISNFGMALPSAAPSSFFSSSAATVSASPSVADFYFWKTMKRTPMIPLTRPQICRTVGIFWYTMAVIMVTTTVF